MLAGLARASQAALRRTVCNTRPNVGTPSALASFVRSYSSNPPRPSEPLPPSPDGRTPPKLDPNWALFHSTAFDTNQGPLTPEKQWANRETYLSTLRRPHDTYTGRSVGVTPHMSLQGAFNLLQRILRNNRVRLEVRRSERHEKKGVKRRRLRSERWRRRFAHEVRKKVQIVNEIRARGA